MSPKSLVVRGYEIPVATRRNLAFYGASIASPAIAVALAACFFRPAMWLCVAWFLASVGLFHLRNVVVRKEVDKGSHDDLYGPHLRRVRQLEFDKRMGPFNRAMIGVTVLVVVAGAALHAAGIDILPVGSKSPVPPLVTK